MTLPDIIGLTGVALLLVTYALLQLDRIDPKGFWYSFNNLIELFSTYIIQKNLNIFICFILL